MSIEGKLIGAQIAEPVHVIYHLVGSAFGGLSSIVAGGMFSTLASPVIGYAGVKYGEKKLTEKQMLLVYGYAGGLLGGGIRKLFSFASAKGTLGAKIQQMTDLDNELNLLSKKLVDKFKSTNKQQNNNNNSNNNNNNNTSAKVVYRTSAGALTPEQTSAVNILVNEKGFGPAEARSIVEIWASQGKDVISQANAVKTSVKKTRQTPLVTTSAKAVSNTYGSF